MAVFITIKHCHCKSWKIANHCKSWKIANHCKSWKIANLCDISYTLAGGWIVYIYILIVSNFPMDSGISC